MYYVYVLQRATNPKEIYFGFSNDLKRRVVEHQKIAPSYTGERRGWKLVYYEAYASEKDARDREKMLKQYGSAKGHLKNRIRRSLHIEN